MSYQNYKNCLFKIDDQRVFVNNININTNADISPVFKQDSKRNDYHNANGPIQTKVDIEYYLTGQDPFKKYLDGKLDTISGDFAGFYFPTGYLSSYSLNAEPNKPIIVRASVDIFDDLRGSYSPIHSGESPEILNYTFASLTQMTSDYSVEDFTYADSISYNYNLELISEYINCTGDNGSVPYRVVYGEKSLELDVSCDNTKMTLPITGDQAGLILNIRDKQLSIVDRYSCSGTLTERSITTSVGSELRTNYKIKQWDISEKPVVSGFTTTAHSPNGAIAFYGHNLRTVKSAKIGKYYIQNLRYNDNNVTGKIPAEATSGLLTVSTEWGEFTSDLYIPSWTYPNINITGISKSQSIAGDKIIISGENFYDISSVKFYNNISSNFRILSPIAIEATVPDAATIGAITATSLKRDKSDTSASFTPYPVITSFAPPEQIVGSNVVIAGTNFSNIDDVKFNAVSATSFTVDSATQITAVVPDGDNAGDIILETTYDYDAYSPYEFYPVVDISSITKTNAKGSIGETITLNLTQSVSAGMLNTTGNSLYLVQFGGGDTVGFSLASSTTLQGKIPDNAGNGNVHVLRSDGASVYGDGIWLDINPKKPIIKDIQPTILFKSETSSIDLIIRGSRLKDIQNIFLFGNYENDDGTVSTEKVTLTTSDFKEDIFGKTLISKSNTKMSSASIGYYDVTVSGNYLGSGLEVLSDTVEKAIQIV